MRTILSMVFIRWEVKATGLKWLGSLGCAVFGTGTTHNVFHRSRTLSRLRLRLRMSRSTPRSWYAQSLSRLDLMTSGSVAFLALVLLSSLLT